MKPTWMRLLGAVWPKIVAGTIAGTAAAPSADAA
jgi:hypothetical protein